MGVYYAIWAVAMAAILIFIFFKIRTYEPKNYELKTVLVENTWLAEMSIIKHGWGNGYVIIPKGHPLWGKDYNEINVNVHGGLTYGEEVNEESMEYLGLDTNDIGAWAIGFDTAHAWDNIDNWPKEKVRQETDRLLEQIRNYKY